MTHLDDLAQRVREERKKRRWTQDELADAAGVDRGTVSNFETRKRNPQSQNLRAILRVLEIEDEVSGEAVAEATRGGWDPDIALFLDVIGLFLDAQPDDARPAIMREMSSWLFRRPRDGTDYSLGK